MYEILFALSLIIAAFLIALAVLAAFALIDHRKVSRLRRFSEAERDAIVFIFDNESLLDATPAARQLLASAPRRGTAWRHLSSLLTPQFPRLNERIIDLADMGEMELRSNDGASKLRAEWHDGVARLTLEAADPENAPAALDAHSLLAMTQELGILRMNAEQMPYPMWRENEAGTITWCNAAYLDLADNVGDIENTHPWPPYRVFELSEDTQQTPASDGDPAIHRVAASTDSETARRWFEISVVADDDGGQLLLAMPADRLVRAETSLQEFVTTLTKTFAALPIGLAIFNRSRELTLFNPALMDLTILPADFLISRPTLSAFLDRLRAARMIPEPKDYKSWRQQMSDLVAAAENGTYEETWALPTGQTYRVTGRPHPDGAVALLFEDISAEISVTRRFRAELETGQATLDALPQALAVFTPGGVLSISNGAYARLWGSDPSTSLGEITAFDAIGSWQAKCAPTPVWAKLRAFVAQTGHRERWRAHIALQDGRALLCRVSPLAHGATLVDFSLAKGKTARDIAGHSQMEEAGPEPAALRAEA